MIARQSTRLQRIALLLVVERQFQRQGGRFDGFSVAAQFDECSGLNHIRFELVGRRFEDGFGVAEGLLGIAKRQGSPTACEAGLWVVGLAQRRVKIIVGGAPVTADYAEKIGADGYAPDASQAVTVVKSLMG